jgi:hypothetical protein
MIMTRQNSSSPIEGAASSWPTIAERANYRPAFLCDSEVIHDMHGVLGAWCL